MSDRILITGATGNVGSQLAHTLLEQGAAVRIGAHNIGKARQQFQDVTDIVHFDFLQSATFEAAFADVKRLFLVRPPALANVERDIQPALSAAVNAGVEHFVFLSIQGVENNRFVPHYKIEQAILELNVDYTFLRAGFFMQNLSTTNCQEIRDDNKIALPVGKAKTSFIDVRDIADVAAVALTTTEHFNKAYTLTGPEALDYFAIADKLSKVLGRPIQYTNPSLIGFAWQQIRQGKSLIYAVVVSGLYTLTRIGNAKHVSNDVEHILGRTAISFDDFALDYKACWMANESI